MNPIKTVAAAGILGLGLFGAVAYSGAVAPASAEPRAHVGRGASDVTAPPAGPFVHSGRGASEYVVAAVERQRVGRGATDQSTMIARAGYGTPAVTLAPVAPSNERNG